MQAGKGTDAGLAEQLLNLLQALTSTEGETTFVRDVGFNFPLLDTLERARPKLYASPSATSLCTYNQKSGDLTARACVGMPHVSSGWWPSSSPYAESLLPRQREMLHSPLPPLSRLTWCAFLASLFPSRARN
jgi:hypothetical protein